MLSLLKSQTVQDVVLRRGNYEFYFACLDRIDMLITEKDSTVNKDQMIKILRTLSHFRPKQAEYLDKHVKAAGYFT